MVLAIGLAMMFAAILIGRAAKIAIPLEPPPWWAANDASEVMLSLAIVTLFTGGLAAVGSWVLGGDWRATNLLTVAGLAVVVAAYVALARAIRAWAQGLRPGSADVVPLAAGEDPREPPRMPPMRKAA